MKANIAVLPGDGVGPEVVSQAVLVLERIAKAFNHRFVFEKGLIGAAAIDEMGDPYPKKTRLLCKKSDAILFGAIGDPKYDKDPKARIRPEQGLLRMRKDLGLYANLRPIRIFPVLAKKSPLKSSVIKNVDFMVVRELTGGIYFGDKGRKKMGKSAYDVAEYSVMEIKRIAKMAFRLAYRRKKHVTVVDKANVLETSRLWREVTQQLAINHQPAITVDYMFVDNAAMQIVKNPRQFDVILTENMFGDILTDEASVITGSIGMLPSASIGRTQALYEPIHGSYPKAAGKNRANPVGAILSTAMMLDYSFSLKKEAQAIVKAVEKTISQGLGTADIAKKKILSTTEMGKEIVKSI